MPSVIIFPLSANSDTLTLLFAHISFQHRAILRSPALPLDHFPMGLQHHVWHCKRLNLLARIIRYRGQAKINRALHRHQVANTPPAQCTNFLPHEIVETIIGHLIYDVQALKACSLTCYSWYIAAFPYIHRTLALGDRSGGLKALSNRHALDLLPFTKEIRMYKEFLANRSGFHLNSSVIGIRVTSPP